MISADHLKVLRNEVSIHRVIFDLGIPTERRGSRLTFRCPRCLGFHTALYFNSNLAHCFQCRVHFNPIDLVMGEKRWDFLQAVCYLDGLFGVSP